MIHSITMKKVKVIFISILFLAVFAGAGLFLAGYFSPKPGGIRIETNIKASVFVNGALVGETPYQNKYKAETILLRLVPLGSSQDLVPYETSIALASGIETVVGRTFEASEELSSGYVISFEKSGKQTSGLIAISQPENSQVLIDGVSRGFSPYSSSTIAPAMHTVTIKSPGYSDLTMTIKTIPGYRLTFYAKLGKESARIPESNENSQINPTKMVEILNTPTGYLRVRTAPGTKGDEVAQVKPGEEYPYLDTDIETGWIEIQYEASKSGLPLGLTGWISGDYATISSLLNQ